MSSPVITKHMKDFTKEREILVQLYSNEAESIKYLPFIFKDQEQLKEFFDMFGGKTLKIPDTYTEFLRMFMVMSTQTNEKKKGIHCFRRYKQKILETYLNLFETLRQALEVECRNGG